MPGVDHDVFTVSLAGAPRDGEEGPSIRVMVDPASAAVLGQREGESLVALVYGLHSSLLRDGVLDLGDIGSYTVGAAGLGLMVSLLTGLSLWWPRRAQLGQAVRVKWRASGKRVTFDLHRAAGIWSAAVLLVIAGSGVTLVFRPWVESLVGLVARLEPRPPGLASSPVPFAAPITADTAVAIAAARVPGGEVTWLDLPGTPRATYRVWLRRSDDVRRVFGDTQVWIDQWSGTVLHVRDRRTLPGGEVFLHWQFPLHNGEVFGLPGRRPARAGGHARPVRRGLDIRVTEMLESGNPYAGGPCRALDPGHRRRPGRARLAPAGARLAPEVARDLRRVPGPRPVPGR
jgi:uncharacterized iron-regulated membrane protein